MADTHAEEGKGRGNIELALLTADMSLVGLSVTPPSHPFVKAKVTESVAEIAALSGLMYVRRRRPSAATDRIP